LPLNDRTTRAGYTVNRNAGALVSAAIQQLVLLIPFLVTGVANSIVGFSTIFFCLFIGSDGITANIAGYAVTLTCSFLLNRHYVFGVRGTISHAEIIRFIAVFITAFGVNMSVLLLSQSSLGEGSAVAQVLAVGAYTLVFYPLTRLFVFRRENLT
jgi:putative flippase GtrA